MERLLNSRLAVLVAWSIVGVLVAGIVGFAVYLLAPAGKDAITTVSSQIQPTASVIAQLTPIAAPGRANLNGTVEKIEERALTVVLNGGETTRVIVRNNAPIGISSLSTVSEIRAGEPVTLDITRQVDGTFVANVVRLQPPEAATTAPTPEARGGVTETQRITGTVSTIEGRALRVKTATGERAVVLSEQARVLRFRPVPLTDLKQGQRVRIDGERLVDGSLAAVFVQVFAQP